LRVQIERRICNYCNYTVNKNKDTFGGNPFACWLSVFYRKQLDFCCEECLTNWLQEGGKL